VKKALVSILLAVTLDSQAQNVAEDHLTDGRLLAGEIVARETQSDADGASARMQMLVRAAPRAVWDVIISCELAFAFVDGLQSCEVLEDTGARALVRQVVNQGWLSPTYDFVFESLRVPFERIDVHLVEGNLRVLDARWVFREAVEGTVVDYQVLIRPSIPAPRFLVRRNLSKGMPDMLACIRGLADGSGSQEQRRQDLERCPGAPSGGWPDQ